MTAWVGAERATVAVSGATTDHVRGPPNTTTAAANQRHSTETVATGKGGRTATRLGDACRDTLLTSGPPVGAGAVELAVVGVRPARGAAIVVVVEALLLLLLASHYFSDPFPFGAIL